MAKKPRNGKPRNGKPRNRKPAAKAEEPAPVEATEEPAEEQAEEPAPVEATEEPAEEQAEEPAEEQEGSELDSALDESLIESLCMVHELCFGSRAQPEHPAIRAACAAVPALAQFVEDGGFEDALCDAVRRIADEGGITRHQDGANQHAYRVGMAAALRVACYVADRIAL